MAPKSLGVVPSEDDEDKALRGESRLTISFLGIKLEAVGKWLERKGAMLGLACIVLAIVCGIVFAAAGGIRLWTR